MGCWCQLWRMKMKFLVFSWSFLLFIFSVLLHSSLPDGDPQIILQITISVLPYYLITRSFRQRKEQSITFISPPPPLHPSRHLPGVMTQQMQNLQLSQTRKCPGGPASPSAAKRLYRNLSEKLRGSTSSFEDAYFFGKTDRLRKASVSLLERKICVVCTELWRRDSNDPVGSSLFMVS